MAEYVAAIEMQADAPAEAEAYQKKLAALVESFPVLEKAVAHGVKGEWQKALETIHALPAAKRTAPIRIVHLLANIKAGRPSHVHSSALQVLGIS